MAWLRREHFFSLNKLNRSMDTLLIVLKQSPTKSYPGKRASTVTELEQSALRLRPHNDYAYKEWKEARVGIDYSGGRRPILVCNLKVARYLTRIQAEVFLAAACISLNKTNALSKRLHPSNDTYHPASASQQ